MTYEKKSVIELREIAKERKIKGISTLKKQELIKVLENYDQEQSKQKEEPQIQREPKQSYWMKRLPCMMTIVWRRPCRRFRPYKTRYSFLPARNAKRKC